MGSFIRLPPRVLDGRIDATYYRPEYVANAQRLASSDVGSSELSSLVLAGRRTLYFGTTTLESDEAPSDWVPFLTSDDLGDEGFFIDTRARRRVAPSFLEGYPAGRLRSGELLVKVKGPNQTTAYIDTAPEYPVLVSGTIWGGLVRKDVVDPYYLVASLSCPYAAMARTRLRTNLNVEFLGAEDLLSLSLPTPDKLAQRYIGDKVRQAGRLRESARMLEAQSLSSLTSALGESPEQWVGNSGFAGVLPSGGFRIKVPSSQIRGRLDPGGYHPELHAIAARARNSGMLFRPLHDLAEVVTDARPRMSSSASLDLYVSVLHVDERGFIDMRAASTHKPESDGRACRPGDVLLSGINPAANRIGVCGDFSGTGACSPEFAILAPRVAVDPHYLAFALRSLVCLRQLVHLGHGTSSSRRRVDEAELANLQVPVVEAAGPIGRAIALKQSYIAAYQEQTRAAKLLVEHLIDGRITEAELVAAQKALEADDRSADRAILKSLRQSDAPDAPALIADVDALYGLLDASEGQDG